MLDLTEDIQSLTTFRRRSGDFLKQLRKSKRPVVLTVNGKAAAIVQDAEAYQRLLDIAAAADPREAFARDWNSQERDKASLHASSSKSSTPRSRKRMAYLVKLMPRAKLDLRLLFGHLHASESPTAFRWYQGLEQEILRLEENPKRCPAAPGGRKLRHLLYGHKPHVYRVICRVLDQRRHVDVLYIRHGARRRFRSQDIV